jgi:hypothetical protein
MCDSGDTGVLCVHDILQVSLPRSVNPYCPASPEKEDQRAAGRPAALTQLALCLRLASILRPKADNAPSTLNDSTRP